MESVKPEELVLDTSLLHDALNFNLPGKADKTADIYVDHVFGYL